MTTAILAAIAAGLAIRCWRQEIKLAWYRKGRQRAARWLRYMRENRTVLREISQSFCEERNEAVKELMRIHGNSQRADRRRFN